MVICRCWVSSRAYVLRITGLWLFLFILRGLLTCFGGQQQHLHAPWVQPYIRASWTWVDHILWCTWIWIIRSICPYSAVVHRFCTSSAFRSCSTPLLHLISTSSSVDQLSNPSNLMNVFHFSSAFQPLNWFRGDCPQAKASIDLTFQLELDLDRYPKVFFTLTTWDFQTKYFLTNDGRMTSMRHRCNWNASTQTNTYLHGDDKNDKQKVLGHYSYDAQTFHHTSCLLAYKDRFLKPDLILILISTEKQTRQSKLHTQVTHSNHHPTEHFVLRLHPLNRTSFVSRYSFHDWPTYISTQLTVIYTQCIHTVTCY